MEGERSKRGVCS